MKKHFKGNGINNNMILLLGLITYTVLIAFSSMYYVERASFIDAAFHLFSLVKDNDFVVINYRFGNFLTQILPLIGRKLEWHLNSIMQLYSLNLSVYYTIIFFLITIVYKQYKLGLVLLLFNILMVRDTFYWMLSEYPQSITLSLLFFAIYLRNKKIQKRFVFNYVWYLILLVTIAFLYPLVVIPFLFMLLFLWINKNLEAKEVISISVVFLLGFAVKFIFFSSHYDDSTTSSVFKNVATSIGSFSNLSSNIQFLHYLIHDYYFLLILLSVNTAFLLWKKKYNQLAFMLISFIGYVSFINMAYPKGADQFYIENLYLPLSLILAFPFCFLVLPYFKNWMGFVSMSIIIFICLLRIDYHSAKFTNRIDWMNNYIENIEKEECKKHILSATEVPLDLWMMTWASAHEFWLLSTALNNESASVYIEDDCSRFETIDKRGNVFITKFGAFDYQSLPNTYFKFKHYDSYCIKSDCQ